jgi:hypothetical protein
LYLLQPGKSASASPGEGETLQLDENRISFA